MKSNNRNIVTKLLIAAVALGYSTMSNSLEEPQYTLLATFGDPNVHSSGYLMILRASDGAILHDVPLPNPGHNGNGNGAPAAPAVGDLDGDGQLEVVVQTFDHGLDVFTIPGSGTECLMWPTARGGPIRSGQAELRWLEVIFMDGFESGTIGNWS